MNEGIKDKLALDVWQIGLPYVNPIQEVSDWSIESEFARCPRRGFYRYALQRGLSSKNWPIQYGIAYHKYREVVEDLMREDDGILTDEIHEKAIKLALEGWEDPPDDHKKAYLNEARIRKAIEIARKRIELEQRTGTIIIDRSEDAFDLELGFAICVECGWAHYAGQESCERCHGELFHARHGGRVDQFVTFRSLGDARMIRDFKTVSRMGKKYKEKFDPNGQMQGYVWSGGELSGRRFEGALVESVYNTKTIGPEIKQHYITYTEGQLQSWLASRMMERSMIQMMFSRAPELGYHAFPQRTTACSDFGGCLYRRACQASSAFEVEEWIKNYTIESVWDFTNPDEEEATE